MRNGGLPDGSNASVPQVSAPVVSAPTGSSTVNLGGSLTSVLLQLGPADPTRDRDGDDVPNYRDLCPDFCAPSPLQWGCPDNDDDGLGIPADYCPVVVGLRNLQGCPDMDGDGVPNGTYPSDSGWIGVRFKCWNRVSPVL